MNSRILALFWLCLFLRLSTDLSAQSVYFFQDATDPGYYDSGLAFRTPPSFLQQAGSTNDKIPVESTLSPYAGTNSLKLRWNSQSGGDWTALVIAPGFPFQNILASDTLSFWVYSATGLDDRLLPLIYMEGAPGNTKSKKYSLAPFTDDIPAQTWTRIKVPLSTFFNDPSQSNINFAQTKAIIFGQDTADATEHILLIDEVKTYAGGGQTILSAPTAFAGKGYDSHVELHWQANTEPNLDGYHLYRSLDNGNQFSLLKKIDHADTAFVDFVGSLGPNLSLQYTLRALNGVGQESLSSDTVLATTQILSDSALLDMVQEATFRYFWDFAHPVSGLHRERNTSGNLVTTGGSGFGIMGLLVGIHRGFISYEQGRDRLWKMVNFLENADRFHGVWPHWMNGTTGATIPFSALDDGGDLVETAFLVQGLLTARQYFDGNTPEDSLLRDKITTLWEGVEWDWYRKLTNQVLYWHWSPNHGWAMNLPIRGFNETHIVYLLAAASPTHSIPTSLYANGWAGGSYLNGATYYGYPLEVGAGKGGPLFFSHYSYLGFDPRFYRDAYTQYFERNYYHTLINQAYCIENPKGYPGYSDSCWGLTASDDPFGYLAHEPTSSGDNGTISPTAALSSIPYTPEQSLKALKHFYRDHGQRLWGYMGFYDAFNLQEDWFASSYLAIDQGPILGMIENYRSQLLWNTFMANPEIGPALLQLGFTSDTTHVAIDPEQTGGMETKVFPNPTSERVYLSLYLPKAAAFEGQLLDLSGKIVLHLGEDTLFPAGQHTFTLSTQDLAPGVYLLRLRVAQSFINHKILIQ